MSDDKNKKGFSGLSSLASDLDETVGDSTSWNVQGEKPGAGGRSKDERQPHPQESAPKPRSAPSPQSEPDVVASGTSRTRTSGSSWVKWIWGLIGVGVLIWLFNAEQADTDRLSNRRTYTGQRSLPSYAPRPTTPTRQAGPFFSKPPVGQNDALSVAQIRWCLREEIRIQVLRPMLTTNSQIDQFNAVVSDYNARCGSFRYKRGALERARREVEQQRAQIVANVSPPWQRGSQASPPSPTSSTVTQPGTQRTGPTTQPSTVQGSQLTVDVQSSLKELGYNPGLVDGLYGARTKSAIQSFQRDAGVVPDGEVSQELLLRLRQESSAHRTRGATKTTGRVAPPPTTATTPESKYFSS